MHKQENCGSPWVNLQQTKEIQKFFVYNPNILGIIDNILLQYHQNTRGLQWCLISSC